jgi:hypothetical protein
MIYLRDTTKYILALNNQILGATDNHIRGLEPDE